MPMTTTPAKRDRTFVTPNTRYVKPKITDAMPIRIDAVPKATAAKWIRTLDAMTHVMPRHTDVVCKETLIVPQIMIERLYRQIVVLPTI